MGNLLSIIVFLCIIIPVINKRKKAKIEQSNTTQRMNQYQAALNKSNSKPSVNKPASVPVSKPQTRGITNKPVPSYQVTNHVHKSNSEAIGNKLMDDRNNDWLANQLREEHRAFKRTSEMFELKIEHVAHCDARYVEQFHHKYCDANKIDTARGH